MPKEGEEIEQQPKDKKLDNVYGFETKQKLNPEELEKRKQELKNTHPTYEIIIDSRGNVVGLPPHLTRKGVILFLDSKGNWRAQNPSPRLLEEIKMWRSDWMD